MPPFPWVKVIVWGVGILLLWGMSFLSWWVALLVCAGLIVLVLVLYAWVGVRERNAGRRVVRP